MKKLFRFIAILFLFIFIIFLTSCTEEDKEREVQKKSSDIGVVDYVDPETGVHYLIYSVSYQGGITVRYNADGTIMVDSIER